MAVRRQPKGKKKAVILLSGGIDSVTTLYFAKSQNYKSTAIIFDYGQRHRREIDSAKYIAKLTKTDYYLIRSSFPWVNSSLTKNNIKVAQDRKLGQRVIPLTYVSGRNIIFLSYGFSLAESIKAQSVFLGAHVQDYSGYPDCRPEFLNNFQTAANSGMKSTKIRIVAPLINKSKREIIRMGLDLGVPFEKTWSCYVGERRPCLRCDSCRFRIQAFTDLGMKDPALKS